MVSDNHFINTEDYDTVSKKYPRELVESVTFALPPFLLSPSEARRLLEEIGGPFELDHSGPTAA